MIVLSCVDLGAVLILFDTIGNITEDFIVIELIVVKLDSTELVMIVSNYNAVIIS